MKIKQAYLVGISEDGEKLTMTTWLDVQPKLKQGARIRLKDMPGIVWEVRELYDDEREASDFDWHRKWDNNI